MAKKKRTGKRESQEKKNQWNGKSFELKWIEIFLNWLYFLGGFFLYGRLSLITENTVFINDFFYINKSINSKQELKNSCKKHKIRKMDINRTEKSLIPSHAVPSIVNLPYVSNSWYEIIITSGAMTETHYRNCN